MKKVLLFMLSLIFFLPVLTAQRSVMTQAELMNQSVKEKIAKLLQNAREIDEFTICQENFTWDTLNNKFDFDGEGSITFEKKGDLKIMTTLQNSLEDDGNLKVEIYFSFQELSSIEGNVFGDSLRIFQGDGMGNYELFSKTLYFYENEQVVLSENYIDFSLFGFPMGFTKSGLTEYRYDNNGFLVETVSDQIDFLTMELVFSDSTVIENNNLGQALVETTYSPDFLTGEVGPDFRNEYTYNDKDQLETELSSTYLVDAFVKQNKYSFSYDDQGRRTTTLDEETSDDGLTWEMSSRSMALYDEELVLDLPSRQLNQDYVNDDWRNRHLTTSEDCTSGLELTEFSSDLTAWFQSDWLNIKTENVSDAEVAVYDLSGKKWYAKKFNQLPEKIFVPGLERGIYLVQVLSEQEIGIVKVFK